MGKPTILVPNRSDINRPVQSQKQTRSLKFWSSVEEELYYPSSENKGTDQLRSYCEADLRLCFRLCRLLVFPRLISFISGKMNEIRKKKVYLKFDCLNELVILFVTISRHFYISLKLSNLFWPIHYYRE